MSDDKKDAKKKTKKDERGNSPHIETEPNLYSETVLTPMARRKRGITMKRHARKIAFGRKKAARRMASPEKLRGRAKRHAISQVRAKVAGNKGKSYSALSNQEKSNIDKKVRNRQNVVDRLAKRLMPQMKRNEMQRRSGAGKTASDKYRGTSQASQHRRIDESANSTPTKRYHELYSKDKKVKADRRFRFNRKIAESVADTVRDRNKVERERQSDKHARKLRRAEIRDANTKYRKEDVNELHNTILGENVSLDESANIYEAVTAAQMKRFMDSALKALHQMVTGDDRHELGWHASEVAKMYGHGLTARSLSKDYIEKYGDPKKKTATEKKKLTPRHLKFGIRTEEGGAGDEATDKLVKKYKKDTPIEEDFNFDNNDLFESFIAEEAVSLSQMKHFEKIVDKLFAKFDIDFEFSRHFRERMDDDRNRPDIKLRELAAFIQKIYRNQGKSIKDVAGQEAVIKDMQAKLNIPIVVKYDKRNDEFDVVAKTIMRKDNFRTPNKVLTYK